ncbi:hypothetical protein JHK86_009761 [Glycine max]|nr:hypothetical protein JHK86_009761 [Glycine max]
MGRDSRYLLYDGEGCGTLLHGYELIDPFKNLKSTPIMGTKELCLSRPTPKHVNYTVEDDDDTSSSATLLATIIGFLSSSSFPDSIDTILPTSLLSSIGSSPAAPPLRPTVCKFSVTSSLSSLSQFSSQIQNPNSISTDSSFFPPCIFLLLASPSSDHHHSHVHMHKYHTFHFHPASSMSSTSAPPSRPLQAFVPNSILPPLDCEPRGSARGSVIVTCAIWPKVEKSV